MIIGVFLCGFLLAYWLAGRYLRQHILVPSGIAEKQIMRRFTIWSLLAAVSGQLAFTRLSVYLGIMQFGQTTNYRIPQDYIAAGPLGWLALAIGAATLVTPLLVSMTMTNQFLS